MLIKLNLSKITAKDVIVLANNRQVLAFKNTWQLQKSASALPKVLSWKQYLHDAWRMFSLDSSKRLLSDIESQSLIAKSITASGQSVNQRLLDEVIKNIDYCHAHLINPAQLARSPTQNIANFGEWMQHYQRNKRQQGLLDSNDLSALIMAQKTPLPKPYIYGFKTLTPEQLRLFGTVGYRTLSAKKENQPTQNKTFASTEDEIRSAAKWASGLHAKHPQKTIAIVSPTLDSGYYQIKSIFDQVFDDVLSEPGQKAYNISLGLPLIEYPPIQQLLLLLKLSTQIQENRISSQTFNAVISSPYIAHAKAEHSGRALLINQVLGWSTAHFTLAKLTPALLDTPILKTLIEAIQTQPDKTKNSYEQWLLSFNTYLKIWGFATDRVLSSSEYQTLSKYQNISLGFNILSQMHGNVSAKHALDDLENHLSQVIFQPQSTKTPVQILGSLEAEGLFFDAAWVMGMTADFLPCALNSPRFIPSQIAARHQIPHSSFPLIAIDAENTLANLINLSKQVIFSYAMTCAEGEQAPSPLLNFEHPPQVASEYRFGVAQQSLSDNAAQPLTQTKIKDGVRVLKDQMACAFKGFSHRLNVAEFTPPHIGFSRAQQGRIIHKVLECIYQKHPSRSALLRQTTDELEQLINHCVAQQLSRYPASQFSKIEHQRLLQIIKQFIDHEKQRDEFRVVACEEELEANIGGLSFTTRLDRIDKMENGERIIFDYKTGKPPSNPWCSKPIKEPQLPIYAISNAADGIGFINLAADKITYIGLAKDPQNLPQAQTQKFCAEWNEQKRFWQQALTEASIDYQQGKASVLPTKAACEYCQYDSLCRVEK